MMLSSLCQIRAIYGHTLEVASCSLWSMSYVCIPVTNCAAMGGGVL